ncbi:MAG: hypothetical protein ACI977_000875 [Candidatus Nanohaloarchaea archaeon]|jgi:hypothetical protein
MVASQENREKYERIFNIILESQKNMLGQKVALKYARKTPLNITPGGELQGYYGEGKSVLNLVMAQYEQVWGKEVAERKIGRKLKDELSEDYYELLTSELREVEPRKGLIQQLKEKVAG